MNVTTYFSVVFIWESPTIIRDATTTAVFSFINTTYTKRTDGRFIAGFYLQMGYPIRYLQKLRYMIPPLSKIMNAILSSRYVNLWDWDMDMLIKQFKPHQKDSLHCAVRKIKYCQRSCQKHIFLKSTTFAFTMERMHSISKCNCVEFYQVTNIRIQMVVFYDV